MTRSYKEAIAKKGSNDVCYKLFVNVLFLRTCFVFVSFMLLCRLIPAIPIQ